MSTTKTKLLWAENIAIQLFKAVEDRNLIMTENQNNRLIPKFLNWHMNCSV
jgi:hypothetical protein